MSIGHTQWDARYRDSITRPLTDQLRSISINAQQRYARASKPAFYVAQTVNTPEGLQRVAWAVLKELGQGRREWLYGFDVVARIPVMERGKPTGTTMLTRRELRWLESELQRLNSPVGEKWLGEV